MSDLTNLIDTFRDGRRLGAEETLAVRRILYADGKAGQDEALALISLNAQAGGMSGEWTTLFVEVMTDLLVYQQDPRGYVDAAQADWLIGAFSQDGAIQAQTELEALIHIIEAADQAPTRLSAFALAQVKAEALGNGPEISGNDVAQMRRVLYAVSGEDGIAVSREEAEVLFDLNDAARGLANDPGWTDLFAHAVGAAILQAKGYGGLDRTEAKRLQDWLVQPASGLGGFMGQMARGLAQPFGKRLQPVASAADMMAAENAAQDRAIAQAEVITDDEADWIVSRIGRDGQFDVNEHALLDFIHAQSPALHARLRPLLAA